MACRRRQGPLALLLAGLAVAAPGVSAAAGGKKAGGGGAARAPRRVATSVDGTAGFLSSWTTEHHDIRNSGYVNFLGPACQVRCSCPDVALTLRAAVLELSSAHTAPHPPPPPPPPNTTERPLPQASV